MNEDLFTSINVHEEEGTLEDRWGPQGWIICTTCQQEWVCNWNAFYESKTKTHHCGTKYTWEPKD